MLTAEMEEVVGKLASDWHFIESFLNNPEKALADYNLDQSERKALLARNTEELVALGVDKEYVEIALSGAHSTGCHIQ